MSTQNISANEFAKDELRARFTSWLDITLSRARSDYFDHINSRPVEASLDEFPPDLIPDPHDYFAVVERGNDFDFEEARLAQAFSVLPLMRREVLRLLFVEMKEPEEISKILHCSTNYVHLQKSRALKRLRELLTEGGIDDE